MKRLSRRSREAVAALFGGLALLAGLLLGAPSVVDIDVGTAEPVTITGVYLGEEHYGRRIRWTDGRARVEWPGVLGVMPTQLEVELASFPGRSGEQIAFLTGNQRVTRHTPAVDWDPVTLQVPSRQGKVSLEVHSPTHGAPGDDRHLGVRLDRVSVMNGSIADRVAAVVWWHALVVVLVGALAWGAGTWLAGENVPAASWQPTLYGAALVVLIGTILAWWRPWLLQPSGLRAVLGAALLGLSLAAVLRRHDAVTRRLAAMAALSCAAIWLVMAIWSLGHFVDVPRWDIWDIVRLTEKLYAGTLGPADFWGAHNEHRPLTARVVMLSSVALAHWNHWYELAALMAVAAVLLLLVARFVSVSQRYRQGVHPLTLVAIALVVFSATQWENWLRGYHVHILVGVVAPVAAFLLLSTGPTTWLRLGGAAALAVLGEVSFGSGLVAWPLGALALLVRRGDGWRPRLIIWIAVSAVAIALYFPGLPERPGYSASSISSSFEVVRLVAGTLTSIAMPIAYRPDVFAGPTSESQMAIVAMAGFAVLTSAVLIGLRWRDDVAREYVWLFPTLLIGFAIGASALAAMGRVSMGLYAMTASRYICYSGCFWVGLLLLLGMAWPDSRRWARKPSALAMTICALAAAYAWTGALPYMDADTLAGRRAREALRRGEIHEAAIVLYPNGPELERMRGVLLEHRLSLFRPGAR